MLWLLTKVPVQLLKEQSKLYLNDNHKLYSVCTQELRKTETTLRTERDQWRDQATANKHEVEKLRGMTELSLMAFWLV